MEKNDCPIVTSMGYTLEKATLDNEYFRRVLLTTKHQQLVLMHLTSEGIPEEVHPDSDQFFKVEEGTIIITLDNAYECVVPKGGSFTVPSGCSHRVQPTDKKGRVNTKKAMAKIYTIYSPPHHPPNTLQKQRPS